MTEDERRELDRLLDLQEKEQLLARAPGDQDDPVPVPQEIEERRAMIANLEAQAAAEEARRHALVEARPLTGVGVVTAQDGAPEWIDA